MFITRLAFTVHVGTVMDDTDLHLAVRSSVLGMLHLIVADIIRMTFTLCIGSRRSYQVSIN